MSNEWKLVPIEPTEEMLQCGWCAAGEFGIDEYRAMIAAAPMSPFRITVHADLIDDGSDQAGRLQAAVDFASGIAPQSDESKIVARIDWDGEGLPPVGAVCEFSDHKEPETWTECRVIAFDEEEDSVVFKILSRDHLLQYDSRFVSSLRPIRTPEQIEAEERNEAQKDIKHIILTSFKIDPITASSIAGVIADSHFRKVIQ